MKKVILMITIALGIILMNVNNTHAFTLNGIYMEPNEAVYLEPGGTSEYSIYRWEFYSTPNAEYYSNLGRVASELDGFDSSARVYRFRSDVLNYIEINYPTYNAYMLPNLQYLVIEDDYPSATLTFYDSNSNVIQQFYYHEITNASPGINPVYIKFEVLAYDYQFYNMAYNQGYGAGQSDGYDLGMKDYGHYDGTNYITADNYGNTRYNDGLIENRDYYGIYHNGNWLTANQYGDLQWGDGYDKGLTNEIDWWSWATTFFLMPFRILNIEILPGVRIGYFALFSLLIGVVGWFFFIVGKGGGKRK